MQKNYFCNGIIIIIRMKCIVGEIKMITLGYIFKHNLIYYAKNYLNTKAVCLYSAKNVVFFTNYYIITIVENESGY